MNISGISPAAPSVTIAPTQQKAYEAYSLIQGQAKAPASDAINTSLMASIKVMDMAQSAFEDAAAKLIETMSAMTGTGRSVDISV